MLKWLGSLLSCLIGVICSKGHCSLTNIPVMCTAVLKLSVPYVNFPALVATSIVAVTTLVSRDA